MIRVAGRKSTGHHIGITDPLDLLEAELERKMIEFRKQHVQQFHEPRRGKPCGKAGEPDQIGEKYGRVRDMVGNDRLAQIEAGYDRHWQNIEKQRLRFLLFDFQLLQEHLFTLAEPLLLDT